MEDYDREFEKYLGEFQPRRPRALPDRVISKKVWTRRLAAAAVIAIGLAAALWPRSRKHLSHSEFAKTAIVTPDINPAPQPLSLLPFTQLALKDPERLDGELLEASRRELPDFRANNSTLRVLAKE